MSILRYLPRVLLCHQVFTVLSLYFHFHGQHDNFQKVPAWARRMVLQKLARVVGLIQLMEPDARKDALLRGHASNVEILQEEGRVEGPSQDSTTLPTISIEDENKAAKVGSHGNDGSHDKVGSHGNDGGNETGNNAASPTDDPRAPDDPEDVIIYKILKHAELLHERAVEEQRARVLRGEWKQIAMVSDRLSVIVFAGLTIATWIYIFEQLPYHTEGMK